MTPSSPKEIHAGPNLADVTLLCFSHLRWDFAVQRPQQLMRRFASTNRVVFWEEPRRIESLAGPRLDLRTCADSGVIVATPELPTSLTPELEDTVLRRLLEEQVGTAEQTIVRWYYTPMMLPFSQHLAARCVVYDCMDDLAKLKSAPAGIAALERRLFAEADLVFTGGDSLHEARRGQHPAVHPFPSSVDALLAQTSWDRTQGQMARLIAEVIARDSNVQPIVSPTVWPAHPAKPYDVMIVGAGFAGAVMAERLAAGSDKRVLVVDRRPHIAGNAFDHRDAAGVLIHQYGPHIFHTNSADIVAYLSRFTKWRPYEHRVLASVDGQLVPIPINRTTINALYGLSLSTDEQAAAFLAARAEPVETIRTSADVVIATVGRELYEKFFRGYTRKQWGMDPSELDKSVTARVPTRTSTDDRYFTDSFQAMPAEGYTRMFERMLDHPNIELLLGVDYLEAREAYPHARLVFTGPIDEYFGYRFGKLPYRSLRFQHETVDRAQFQDVAVVNYPSPDVPYTRVTEYKHLTGQVCDRTSITYEYPAAEGDPYYPIPRAENMALFKRYEALALAEPDVVFVGRLATYRYYNMDQVVGQALATYRRAFVTRPNSTREAAGVSATA